MNATASYQDLRDEDELLDSPCTHESTHRETVSGGASWNPFTQDCDEEEYLIEVCDDCDEEIFNEYGNNDDED